MGGRLPGGRSKASRPWLPAEYCRQQHSTNGRSASKIPRKRTNQPLKRRLGCTGLAAVHPVPLLAGSPKKTNIHDSSGAIRGSRSESHLNCTESPMGRQEHRIERRLVAIFAADVAGYSRLMEQDEVGTLRSLTAHRAIMDQLIAEHGGRVANTAGDSVLAEFPSAVDAVHCAVDAQHALSQASRDIPEVRRLQFRIGVHVGDVMVRGGDLLGDGVNIAARVQALARPGGICVSGAAHAFVRKALALEFDDLGPQKVKNIDEPVWTFRVVASGASCSSSEGADLTERPLLPDKPSIALLPFTNLGGDPEQEYFADGVVEDIITALSHVPRLFVIARNSTFSYKRHLPTIREVGYQLGVRYVREGSIRRADTRPRISAQLIEADTEQHLWADHFDGQAQDVFELQDQITAGVIGAIMPQLVAAEVERAKSKRPENRAAKHLVFPTVIDPADPPIRPERHVPTSIPTLRRRLTVALANRLQRCPCCTRAMDSPRQANL